MLPQAHARASARNAHPLRCACLQVGGPTALEILEAAAAAAEAEAAAAEPEAVAEPPNLLRRFGNWLKSGF